MKKSEIAQAEKEHDERDYKLRFELLERIYGIYGTNQIMQLNVFLPYPEAEKAFNFWLEAYANNQLIARSDEVKITFLFDNTTSEILIRDGLIVRHSSNPKSVAGKLVEELPIGGVLPYERDMIVAVAKTSGDAISLTAKGRLNIVIPELGQLATWMVVTGAWSDIASIYSAVDIIGQLSRVTGRPANTFPLVLKRVPRQQKYEDEKGKSHSTVKHYIEATVVSDAIQGLLTAYEGTPFQFQLMPGDEQLEESFDEDVVEPEEIVPDVTAETAPNPPEDEKKEIVRPFDPETLRGKIANFIDFHSTKRTGVPENASRVLASQLDKIFGNSTDRYVFTAWILNRPEGSTKTMVAAEIRAFLDWLEVEGFGTMPNEISVIEAKMCLDHINEARGQMTL